MILTFRPMTVPPAHWLDVDADRPWSQFSATYEQTLRLLDRELDHLGARDAFLQVVASERDVRLDGALRSDAKVAHPGVLLTIDTIRLGTLVYETDRYRGRYGEPGWKANLRAIALGLEALRTVERYGIARRGEQYAGYRELPPGIPLGAAMTLDEAAELLMPDDPYWLLEVGTVDDVGERFRWVSKTLHPDAGGDPDEFRRLAIARDLVLASIRSRA